MSWNYFRSQDVKLIESQYVFSGSPVLQNGWGICLSMIFGNSGDFSFHIVGVPPDAPPTRIRVYLSNYDDFYSDTGQPIDYLRIYDGYTPNLAFSYYISPSDVQHRKIYRVWVRCVDPEDTVKINLSIDLSKITPWSWYDQNFWASPEITYKAYQALNEGRPGGHMSDFNYLVWNDMCNKVSEIRTKSGKSWNKDYGAYRFLPMNPEDKKLTAQRFKSLVTNLDSIWDGIDTGIDISKITPGSPVKSQYFLDITNTMNNIIQRM